LSQLILAELLTPDRIRIPIEARDKVGVIEEMCAFLADRAGAAPDAATRIRDAVLAREEVLTTGIGGGIAIPHGKSEEVGDLVLVAGRTAHPVDFDSLDEKPVRLVMLLVGPESAAGSHVKALSRISRTLRSRVTRRRLIEAATPQDFHETLAIAEAGEHDG
jgi:mannitol/fructose-specific phosphotransferase system IIA component (Ntr-type)